MWSELRSTAKLVLWCDGLQGESSAKCKQKRGHGCESDDDEQGATKKRKTKSQDKEEQVQDIVDTLKEKHGSKFTVMQLRIWAEMIAGSIHMSTDDPPGTSMFVRAGGQAKKGDGSSPSITKAITDAACAITNVLTPKQNLPNKVQNVSTCSPVKAIENRSKLYKQLSELNNLKSSGVLTEEEYVSEKQAIMALLQEINTRN